MTKRLAPVLRTADANAAVAWYARLGFTAWGRSPAPEPGAASNGPRSV
ncbi:MULTISPECIES: hypothetical protein [Micromonospora]|nr:MULTISPECIES: hypothetical protein [Micromonospora]NES13989.1 hypothetical protein [Micromonospora sp. PPF5-17B]NES37120.1 hypothetical protein [Micromonospora solifontis]NES54089.1 hypothetical protein [Micromonospora sp. PPF5-6]